MADIQIAGEFAPIGGGMPIHASQFQVVIDTSEVVIVFMQRSLDYAPGSPIPTVSHRIVGQITLSHMLAKDMIAQFSKALGDFEVRYPIPVIMPDPPKAPAANAR